MFVKLTSSFLVGIDVLVNPFMTDVGTFMLPHPQRDLLWAPILADPFLNPGPGLRLDALPVPFTSIYSVAVGLFRPISSLTLVPFQLSADGRFMYSYCFCYFRLFMVTFQKCLNLISLTLGKLVVTHKRSFDFVVCRGLYYTRLPLSTFKVALTS